MAPAVALLIFLFPLQLLRAKVASAARPVALPGCKDMCGNVSIPYPFGIGPGCSRDTNFQIYCNGAFTPAKAYLFSNKSNMVVIDISLLGGHLRIFKSFGWECYDKNGNSTGGGNGYINLNGLPNYMLSHTGNMFTAIGCYTLALIRGRGNDPYTTGCATLCQSVKNNLTHGECSGVGCCQTSIPRGLKYYDVRFFNFANLSSVWGINRCRYAFLAEKGWYTFNKSDLQEIEFYNKHRDGVPMVIDWVAGAETCEQAKLNRSSYACVSANSSCYNATDVGGYRCNCSSGYEGNPYLADGCQDINECERPNEYPCSGECANHPGNYSCSCPKGTELDPATKRCRKKPFPTLPLALGLSIGLLVLFILGSWIYWGHHRRKMMMLRQKFFEQNGGLLLKRQITSQHGATFKIFSKEEIERATNKFDKQMILGQGGQGTVYRGDLGNREVAIKKSRVIDESQRNEFATEMLILSQINHRNVVKLLGCCLEVDIPMLVYEFVSNGTLFHYIHREKHRSPVSFIERLRIATEAAQALHYLHAEASPPIVHGDVKSGNILLDDKFMVKVSDFGASKMTPLDKAQFATLVQGTYGYLDPESLQTHQLTAKSDVYSFGVILAELLTGKMALYSDGSGKERSLALDFVSSVKNNQLLQILDVQIVNEGIIEYVHEVGKLTCRCLNMTGEERPPMKEVAMELEGMGNLLIALWEPHNAKDMDPLLGEQSSCYASNTSTYFGSTNNALNIHGGR